MNNVEEWKEIDLEEDHIYGAWEHEETGDELRVSKFEDGTWDTFLNERLIANRDSPEEAVERARKLTENGLD